MSNEKLLELGFNTLCRANMQRLPLFKNSKGEPAHSEPDGSDWSPAQWLQAIVGELGEYANKRKKFERGDITEEEFLVEAKKELADVQIYLDLLAFRLGIDLGQAVKDKFNEVSRRIGVSLYLRTWTNPNEDNTYPDIVSIDTVTDETGNWNQE